MTIGVWGGGFIGLNLLASLIGQGQRDLCLLTRGHESWITVSGLDLQARHMTFNACVSDMEKALSGVSVLVHCAGTPYDQHGEYLQAAVRMAEAAVAAGVRRVILLSTVAVYGSAVPDGGIGEDVIIGKETQPQPQSLYAQSRYGAETRMRSVLQKAGVEFLAVRVPMVVGAGMNASVFRRLSALLARNLAPSMGRRNRWLPCIGIHRLRNVLAKLVLAPPPLQGLYQFADRIAWGDVLRLCDPSPGHWKLFLPVSLIYMCASSLGFSRIASLARSLLNTSCYADDSELVSPGSCVRWPTADCVVDAVKI